MDSANAESQTDFTTAKVAKHDFATIKSMAVQSTTLKALSGWGIFKGEGATSQFKPLPLIKKSRKNKIQHNL
ncbi:hypothetical protein C6B36_08595 [Helicobacter cinaedi]|nr:hypothetical protein C6B36_08595 [Helicobacter cinaedi]QOQ97162.1 hypothetical protein HW245_04920 [Helicobacter cinaedi]